MWRDLTSPWRRRRGGTWSKVGWTAVAVFSSLTAVAASRWVTPCTACLSPAPEPAGWRTWPLVTGNATALASGLRRGEQQSCPVLSSQVEAAADEGGTSTWLRGQGTVLVLARRTPSGTGERFVAAFDERRGLRFVAKGPTHALLIGMLLSSALATLVALGRARARGASLTSIGLATAPRGAAPYRGDLAARASAPAAEASSFVNAPIRRTIAALALAWGVGLVLVGLGTVLFVGRVLLLP